VLWNGVLGTSMPAWRDRAPQELAALTDVVRGFSTVVADGESPELDALGEQAYRRHCAECHGETGNGDGFAAAELAIAPTSFRGQRATLAENLRVLTQGIDGTSMAPWTGRLDGDELMAVAHYVQGLYVEE
jgi:mono/diheme cytochrome c family protein